MFRTAVEDRYVVNRGPGGVLTLVPYSVWLEKFRTMAADKSPAERREARRKMSLASQVVEPDQQGRIAVAKSSLDEAGIDRKIAMVGMGDYIELWNPEALERTAGADDEIDADVLDAFYD